VFPAVLPAELDSRQSFIGRELPPAVRAADRPSVRTFLRTLLHWVHGDYREQESRIASHSRELMEQLQLMLLNFGIYCRRGPFCNGFALTFDCGGIRPAQYRVWSPVAERAAVRGPNGELRGGPGGGHQSEVVSQIPVMSAAPASTPAPEDNGRSCEDTRIAAQEVTVAPGSGRLNHRLRSCPRAPSWWRRSPVTGSRG